MMKYILIIVAVAVLGLTANGQNKEFPSAIHAKINLVDYGMLFDGAPHVSQGFEVGYYRNIGRYLNVGVPIKMAVAKIANNPDNTVTTSIDAVFHLQNIQGGAKVSPYLMGGLGLFTEKFSNPDLHFPFGAGLDFSISRYAFINTQLEFRKAIRDNRDNLQLGVGFVYLLHREEPEPKPIDTDNDSIPDLVDLCPDVKGPASALGCPDKDGDGLGDKEDQCPDQKGSLETNGCPDSDHDGIVDKEDPCPNEAGSANGCPDKDKDGFADKDDECPALAGRWNGCPDTDFDGVADKDDECPNDPGNVTNKGCPGLKDTDKDGVADAEDKCPDVAGELNGCPDTDKDGMADKDDPCPTAAGTFGGCPDTDGDGLADNLDKCPTMAGVSATNGCPEIKKETKERLAFAMKAVQFETNKADLKMESYAILDELFNILKQYPDYKLAISGHTDNVGTDEANMALSAARAKACMDYFVFRGMPVARLRSSGFGASRPMASNDTAAGKELNRRVEFELVTD